jgi:hypothetical protein
VALRIALEVPAARAHGGDVDHRRACIGISLAALAVIAPGRADASDGIAAPPDPQGIYGGAPAAACAWPSAVFLGGCTGTLVHPEVVIYAAHCGSSVEWAWFGEDSNQQQGTYVGVEFCSVFPGGTPGYGNDFAVCKLAEPVTDVPIVPPLMGCEADELVAGATVTLPGYGMNDEVGASGHGIKRWTTNTVESVDLVNNDLYLLGTDGASVCYGDSGGPAYLQLSDGSWRVVGITSEGHPAVEGQPTICGYGAIYDLVHLEMEFFEGATGYDLTPCFDTDGTWSPDETCGAFPTSLTTAGLDWGSACATEELSGWSATCGEPFVTEGTGSTGEGSDTGDDSTGADPSTGDVTGPPPPPDTTTTSDLDGSSTSTSGFDLDGSGSTGTTPPASGDDDGCGCRTRTPGGLAWMLVLLVGCVRRRR